MNAPTLDRCEYLADHEAWFWTVSAPDPSPALRLDGDPRISGARLTERGVSSPCRFGRPTRKRDWDIERAKRKIEKKVARWRAATEAKR